MTTDWERSQVRSTFSSHAPIFGRAHSPSRNELDGVFECSPSRHPLVNRSSEMRISLFFEEKLYCKSDKMTHRNNAIKNTLSFSGF